MFPLLPFLPTMPRLERGRIRPFPGSPVAKAAGPRARRRLACRETAPLEITASVAAFEYFEPSVKENFHIVVVLNVILAVRGVILL
jgi:hypothetical protein